jgi:hypothetical protein
MFIKSWQFCIILFFCKFFSNPLQASSIRTCYFKALLFSSQLSNPQSICSVNGRKTFEIEITSLSSRDNMVEASKVATNKNPVNVFCDPFILKTKNNFKLKVTACSPSKLELKKDMWVDLDYTHSISRGGQESKSFEITSEYHSRAERKKRLLERCRRTKDYSDCTVAAEYLHYDKEEASLEEAYIHMCTPGPGGCSYLINFYHERNNLKRLEEVAQKLKKQCDLNIISACEMCGNTYAYYNLKNPALAEKCLRRACKIEKNEIKWRHDACRSLDEYLKTLKKNRAKDSSNVVPQDNSDIDLIEALINQKPEKACEFITGFRGKVS